MIATGGVRFSKTDKRNRAAAERREHRALFYAVKLA